MGSTLYLGADQESLADRLISRLAEPGRDLFTPVTIVVPNRYLAKWLRLRLARHLGVAINLQVGPFLEQTLWDLLRSIDGRNHARPLQLLSDDDYQLMLVAALLDDDQAEGQASVRNYLGPRENQSQRAYWRRLWQLGGRLAGLIRDYEYHRQEALVLKWLKGEDGYPTAGAAERDLERAQHALFDRIVAEPDGLRARLGAALSQLGKSLPQYAGEVGELKPSQLRKVAGASPIHLFGLTQISWLHVHTLRWLGRHFDLHLYHRNPLAGDLSELPRTAAQAFGQVRKLAGRFRATAAEHEPSAELLRLWGHAGAESLWLMADLLDGKQPFRPELVPARPAAQQTVLVRLQEHLTGAAASGGVLTQDKSVQIVACPGVSREVETVYHSILGNLQRDPTLRQTDVAVLVTDMARYRPAIQTVFDRAPQRLLYNLADFSAAELSPFGHAVLGLLDLALESFSRSRVFAVLLNPCFLARQNADRTQAATWLNWVEELGVFNGWDRNDKKQRGYADSPLYSWRLGLQRLRLGRLMEVADEHGEVPATRFHNVIPFADLASGDKEQLDTFSRSVEGLLPRLAALRALVASGEHWVRELRQLCDDFLAVPDDRPQEEEVRAELFRALERLKLLDALHPTNAEDAQLPLPLVREFVQENLEGIKAVSGEFLTGGVTVSALQPLLPLPFRIVYVLGLGEDIFPGSNTLSALDPRTRELLPGDIRPAEANRFLFLEALLAAREKVYLLHNSRDLQKDQELHPASTLNQLRRFLKEHVLGGTEFKVTDVPLRSCDPIFLRPPADAATSDCKLNFSDKDRLLAIEEARASGALRLDRKGTAAVEQRLRRARPVFSPPRESIQVASPVGVSLGELRNFLGCPVEAALKRHLRLYDNWENEPSDDEPFSTPRLRRNALITEALQRFLKRARTESVDAAQAGWRDQWRALHDEWQLRGRLPEGAFAEADRSQIEHELQERIEGSGGLADFLRERADADFCGPVLLGESATPVGARTRLGALRLSLGGSDARLTGTLPLVWRGDDAVDVLVLTNRNPKQLPADHLSLYMLEPVLFHLALRAGPEAGSGRIDAEDWLGGREFRVHATHRDGMVHFTYRPEDASPQQVRTYLAELAADFLDRSSFDLLPFNLIAAEPALRVAYEGEVADAASRAQYAATLRDALDEDQEDDFPAYWPMRLLEFVATKIPDDAYDKVRRRFLLLDRAPLRLRQQLTAANSPEGDHGDD